MAAEIKKATGLDAQLIVGSSGEFTVWLDGKLLAEKKGNFPEPAQVVDAVKAALAPT